MSSRKFNVKATVLITRDFLIKIKIQILFQERGRYTFKDNRAQWFQKISNWGLSSGLKVSEDLRWREIRSARPL